MFARLKLQCDLVSFLCQFFQTSRSKCFLAQSKHLVLSLGRSIHGVLIDFTTNWVPSSHGRNLQFICSDPHTCARTRSHLQPSLSQMVLIIASSRLQPVVTPLAGICISDRDRRRDFGPFGRPLSEPWRISEESVQKKKKTLALG